VAAPLSERELELLNAYIDNELPPNDRAAFEQRLAQDAFLRSEVDAFRATKTLLQMAERVPVPRNFTLDPAVYGKPQRGGITNWLGSLAWPALGFAGTLAAVMLVFGLFLTLVQSDGAFREGTAQFSAEPAAQSADEAFGDAAAEAPQPAEQEMVLEAPAEEEEAAEEEEMAEEEPAVEEMLEESAAEAEMAAEPAEPTGEDNAISGGGAAGNEAPTDEGFQPFEEAAEAELAEGESDSAVDAESGEGTEITAPDADLAPPEAGGAAEEPLQDGADDNAAEALRTSGPEAEATLAAEQEAAPESQPESLDTVEEQVDQEEVVIPGPMSPGPPAQGVPILGVILIALGVVLAAGVVAAIGAKARS